MKKSDFFYNLPDELIAQTPIEPRDHSRMLYMNRKTGEVQHGHFYDIIDYLNPGDTLVVNNSRVLPARLYGIKEHTGGAMQFLLLEQKEKDVWEVMVRPGKKAKTGSRFLFGEGLLLGEILGTTDGGNRLAKMYYDGNFYDILEKIGNMPLPPYITETLQDNERYQTVYSKQLGSAAAPTAGLHFTTQLMDRLKEKGIAIAEVTLHVGIGTFRPVKVEEITQHHMHSEHYFLPKETADLINETKARGNRVIAVGTTSCRTLESVAAKEGCICQSEGYTDIFIYPGFKFQVLDGLITNFHLPESTLIMLVSAFAGYEHTMRAYDVAVKEKYRFFSFGDAMLLL
ncbi:tRNA preQ1(34) S-adenosylmethionine ribosyltransferase-isomerase QueA [Youxingia wuxianensis]|uniref:S-adenosylmethionine:tRNA ribosyltransferase-isomerase n=1 Tax=Youxingia wuxianensis TaxID=2763678 RepID=A0A926IGK8_9FIRM|nr:tRNA preQ1(34) S-adenosylmethionine ribosyltransferase-isomerase QueA [Youxingia wuxianensis]MBC8584356.1 tRNA preQ1(34) S-adenosylmethionine ribosyltransferase-isomerase QueA [Youxingia wuxianensis]